VPEPAVVPVLVPLDVLLVVPEDVLPLVTVGTPLVAVGT